MSLFLTTEQPTQAEQADRRRPMPTRQPAGSGWDKANAAVIVGTLIAMVVPVLTVAGIGWVLLSIMAALAEWTS